MGRVLQQVARRRAPRRWNPEEPQGDVVPLPILRQQQALQARLGAAEQADAAHRAQVLITQGWGALEGWLLHEGQHPGERLPGASDRHQAEQRIDLFEAA